MDSLDLSDLERPDGLTIAEIDELLATGIALEAAPSLHPSPRFADLGSGLWGIAHEYCDEQDGPRMFRCGGACRRPLCRPGVCSSCALRPLPALRVAPAAPAAPPAGGSQPPRKPRPARRPS